MKRTAIILIQLIMLSAVPVTSREQVMTTEKLAQKLRQTYIPVYQNYLGYTAQRKSRVVIRDAKTGKLYRTVDSLVDRKVYFYKKAEKGTVYRYVVDGKPKPVSDYKGQKEGKPAHPFFDSFGHKHYQFKLEGTATVRGKSCYTLKVIPREQSERHLKGIVYIDKLKLRTVRFTGTQSKLSFGIKRINFVIDFNTINGFDLPIRSRVRFLLDIPVFFPDKDFDITSELSGHRMMPR